MHVSSERAMNLLKWLFGKSKKNTQPAFCIEKTVRILCMGKQGVGKTSVVQKLCGIEDFSENYLPTIYDDHLKEIIIDECNVSFQFMDLGGSQSFPSMQEVFISQADIYLLFYAVDDAESFDKMLEYRDKITAHKGKHSTELPLLIIRNKVDMKQRRLRKEVERRKTINQWCGKVYDVSAKTGIKINSIMDSLIEESKFIGNEMDRGNMKISGRYLYQEQEDNKREFSASEVYHKAPTLFGEKDNSDEKMEKRRRRSLQQPSRKMSMRRTGDVIRRGHSFSSLRRKNKEPGIPPWMKAEEEKQTEENKDGKTETESTPIMEKVSFEKTASKETIESISPKDTKKTSDDLDISEKRNVFKTSGKKSSVTDSTESPSSSPAYLRPRHRKKSLSHQDLSLLRPEIRDRSSSMNSPMFIRKVNSFRSKNKPVKPQIVHTTLKSEENDEAIPILEQHRYRTQSSSSKDSPAKPSRSSGSGRKVSISIDHVSDGEYEADTPPPSRLTHRRRSLSQNDLSLSVKAFNKSNNRGLKFFQRGISHFDDKTPDIFGKKQKSSLPARISDDEATPPSINKRRARSSSIHRKKNSTAQVQSSVIEHIAEVDEEEESEKCPRLNTNMFSVTEGELQQRRPRTKSFDENKNYIVNTKSKSRPPLHKGASFDLAASKDQSPPSANFLLS